MGNLKVADDEYQTLVEHYSKLGEKFETVYKDYGDILAEVCKNALSDGEVFENLKAFSEIAQILQGQFGDIVCSAQELCGSFISDVDYADDYLYD